MGLSTVFSNLSAIILVALLAVCVLMFFYFRQKISEIEKASINQAKILHSFISQTLAMQQNLNSNVRLSNVDGPTVLLTDNNQPINTQLYENSNPKEKITVSDDDEDSQDDSSDEDDDDSSSTSSESSLETSEDDKKLHSLKIREITENEEIEHLETPKVKKIFLNSNEDASLLPFEIHNLNSHLLNQQLDGSCDLSSSSTSSDAADDESLSELSDEDDDGRVADDDLSNPINIMKLDENKSINLILNNLTNQESNSVDVSDISIVKKSTSHNTSLKEKDDGNELRSLKVDLLRQLVIDKSLASSEEAKKLKKKDLLVLLGDKNNI